MNWAHVHLVLNHLPVLGTIFGAALLGVAFARRNETLTRTSLGVFVLGAAVAVPTYLTGEPAEETVERMAGISKSLIETHEEAALLALLAVMVLGLIGLAGLFASRRGKPVPRGLQATALAVSLVTGGLMTRTAQLGGQIHHEEIRVNGTRSPDHAGNGPARGEAPEERER